MVTHFTSYVYPLISLLGAEGKADIPNAKGMVTARAASTLSQDKATGAQHRSVYEIREDLSTTATQA